MHFNEVFHCIHLSNFAHYFTIHYLSLTHNAEFHSQLFTDVCVFYNHILYVFTQLKRSLKQSFLAEKLEEVQNDGAEYKLIYKWGYKINPLGLGRLSSGRL